MSRSILSHFFGDALSLKRPSLICSFHFTKWYVVALSLFLFPFLSLPLSLSFSLFLSLSFSPFLFLSLSRSLSLKVPHLIQIYGRFRPCYNGIYIYKFMSTNKYQEIEDFRGGNMQGKITYSLKRLDLSAIGQPMFTRLQQLVKWCDGWEGGVKDPHFNDPQISIYNNLHILL